jgi:hypothetical protein
MAGPYTSELSVVKVIKCSKISRQIHMTAGLTYFFMLLTIRTGYLNKLFIQAPTKSYVKLTISSILTGPYILCRS